MINDVRKFDVELSVIQTGAFRSSASSGIQPKSVLTITVVLRGESEGGERETKSGDEEKKKNPGDTVSVSFMM